MNINDLIIQTLYEIQNADNTPVKSNSKVGITSNTPTNTLEKESLTPLHNQSSQGVRQLQKTTSKIRGIVNSGFAD